MRTLCLDQSTTICGFVAIEFCGEKPVILGRGTFNLGKEKDVNIRLGRIKADVIQLMEKYQPDEMVIENHRFRGKSAFVDFDLIKAGDRCSQVAEDYGIPVYMLWPSTVRSVCGAKSKMDVAVNACRYWGIEFKDIQDYNEGDALGIAMTWVFKCESERKGRQKKPTQKQIPGFRKARKEAK